MAVKPRIVVVGIGSIGRRHARLLRSRTDIEVEWCEPDPALLASAAQELIPPSRVHHDFDTMISTAPEMVVLATPHAFHADQSIKALAAGAHVLCEKPMADCPESAHRMLSAARTYPRVLNIGFHLHFHPGLRRLKSLIDSGALGSIAHLHCRVGSYVTLSNSRTRYQKSLEGALMLDYAHQPDLLFWLLGKMPAGVYAAGAHVQSVDHHSNPNVLSVNFDYAHQLICTIHLNYLQAPERHEYEVVGDEGWAILDLTTARLTVGLRRNLSTWNEEFTSERDSLYVAEHQAFLDAVNGVSMPESPPDRAIASVYITAAALSSWRSHKRVMIASTW
ncbi:MAG: Gfo/Idh/MocA family oxidoreductase [Opitutaceae bacterium]|jgi:predicted dehydrogenase|nr:Gfo/Idh/MocA family oxidoreductase [Opitutaceae bacterium]